MTLQSQIRRVLEQEARIRDLAPDPLLMHLPLQLPRFQVVDARAQPGKHQLTAHKSSLAAVPITSPSPCVKRDIA